MSVVSPFQGLVVVILFTQGDAARLSPLRFALGWCVAALSGLFVDYHARPRRALSFQAVRAVGERLSGWAIFFRTWGTRICPS